VALFGAREAAAPLNGVSWESVEAMEREGVGATGREDGKPARRGDARLAPALFARVRANLARSRVNLRILRSLFA